MRIGLLSYEYPPDTGFGGIGSYTWHHARALASLGHEVHVLAGASQAQAMRSREQDGVHVHRYWAGDSVMRAAAGLGRWHWWWTRQRLQNAWSMARGLRQLQRRHRLDVIEMPECGAEGALLTLYSRVPTVVRLHSPSALIMPFYDVRPGDITACAAVERQALRRATAVSACSAFVARETGARLGLRQPATLISNGLDLEWFDHAAEDAEVLRRLGLPADRPIVLFTGRLEARKGVHLCRDIAASVLARHDVSLVLAGDDLFGHYRNEILPALQGLALRGSLHWVGRRSIEEVRALVRHCSVFLLPSLWENCPYACLEAMAAGRAIVAARQGGLPELLRDGENGRLANVGDAASFARCVSELLDDEAQRQRLGAQARQSVERHHRHTHVARQALRLYSGLQSGAGRP